MNERIILESTYRDKAAVYRRENRKDTTTKQTHQEEIVVNPCLPCALSQNKSGQLSLSGGTGSTSGSYTLFCTPDADIKAGDKLLVTTASGQQFSLWAGKGFAYSSHIEVPLSSEERG